MWCRSNLYSRGITPAELRAIATPGHSVGDLAVFGLANVLQTAIAVVFQTVTSQEKQLFCPSPPPSGSTGPALCLYFHMYGHYDALVPCSTPSPFLHNQNWHQHNTFLQDLDRRATRKRDRGAGQSQRAAHTEKKRARKAPVAFATKPLIDRQFAVLTWLLGESCALRAMEGREKVDIGSVPQAHSLPNQILDESVRLTDVRDFFSKAARHQLQKVVQEKDEATMWRCSTCNKDIQNGEFTIGCDSCLDWHHLPCVCLTRKPKKKHWFCPTCKP